MKKTKKVIFSIFAAVSFMLVGATNVFAEGSVSIVGDKETAVVGDTYTVSITVENSEGAAVAPEVSVNFDSNRLSFVTCNTEYGGGAGGLITLSEGTSDIAFTILSGGQADVTVCAIFDGDGANSQLVTASVMVDGEDTAATNEYARAEETSGVEAGSIVSPDGSKVVSTVFASEFMPAGFYKTTVSYEEQMVEAAQFDMGNIVLLYVTDADGNNGNFDIYDQNTGELSDFLQISGIENRFIIALKAGEDVKVPEGFAKATLQWNAQTLEAYSYVGDIAEDAPIPASDFFLLYAMSSEGNTGWYMYDQNEGTYQRFLEGLHGASATPSTGELISQITTPVNKEDGEDKGKINIAFIVVVAIALLLLILLITVIVMGIKLREFNSYDYIDEDEDGSDNSFLNNAMAARTPEAAIEDISIADASDSNGGKAEMPQEKVGMQQTANTTNDMGFVVRKKTQVANEAEKDELEDDEVFSPRGNSRAERKAAKAEEKARKKQEKKMKKEFGEFGPVDWQSWQDAVEGGERTAAMAMGDTQSQMPRQMAQPAPQPAPVRHEQPAPQQAPVRQQQPAAQPVPARQQQLAAQPAPVNQQQPAAQPVRREQPAAQPAPVRQQQPAPQQAEEARRAQMTREEENAIYPEDIPPKNNPMEIMRNIPANDNKAPVQARPVQQFDFDDDFEFEFLNLDDDD